MNPALTLLALSSLLLSGAQAWWVPVNATPYDAQMRSSQAFLASHPPTSSSVNDPAFISALMRPIHHLPYRFHPDWPTPDQVRISGRADCKGKSILLLDQLRQANIHDALLVIGMRTPGSRQTHAWLELTLGATPYVLDPTYFPKPVPRDSLPANHYQRHFGYAGTQRWSFIAPGWLVAAR